MRKLFILLLLSSTSLVNAGETSGAKPVLQNLMTDKIAGVNNREVIVSHVIIPPNTSLAKHWHPGEEYAYVIKGSVTLWQKGKKNTVVKKGDAIKVPLKQIHTAITQKEGAEVLVFRIHETGKANRYLVDK